MFMNASRMRAGSVNSLRLGWYSARIFRALSSRVYFSSERVNSGGTIW